MTGDVLLQIIDSPLLAALVAVGGVIATIMHTNRRERDRADRLEEELRELRERQGRGWWWRMFGGR